MKTQRFARRCDATGRGMNEGYVVGDGELYFSDEKSLVSHLRELNWFDDDGNLLSDVYKANDDLIDYYYNNDYCYFTTWEEINDDYYYDAEGNEYETN